MTLYLDKKERVYDLKLTGYGKYLLSIGSFKPTYYAFFDDNIIYDGTYAHVSESQNGPINRIQNETHFHEGLVLFEDIDAIPSNNKGSGINYFDLDITPTKELPRKDTFKYDAALGDAHYDGRTPNYAPAWKVVALNGKITHSGIKDHINELNIPQVNVELIYQKTTEEAVSQFIPENEAPTDVDVDAFVSSTDPFLDDMSVSLLSDDATIYIEELNTTNLVHNFDLEVFEMIIDPASASSGSITFDDLPAVTTNVVMNNGNEQFTYHFTSIPEAWNAGCSPSCPDLGDAESSRINRAVYIDTNTTKCMLNLMAAINDTSRSGLEAQNDTSDASRPKIKVINRNIESYGLYGPISILNKEITTSSGDLSVAGFLGAKARKEQLKRKFFQKDMPQIVDGFMVSETPTLKFHDAIPSSSVEYYFDINADYDADPAEVCKYSQILNRDSYFIDLDFDCDQSEDKNTYFDIYGTEGEPEICLD